MSGQPEDYLVTVRAHNVLRLVTPMKLGETFQHIVDTLPLEVVDVAYERHGRYRQLHAHALVRANARFRYRGHTQRRGLRIHWIKIYNPDDLERVKRYVRKYVRNIYEQEQVLAENELYYVNGFS